MPVSITVKIIRIKVFVRILWTKTRTSTNKLIDKPYCFDIPGYQTMHVEAAVHKERWREDI